MRNIINEKPHSVLYGSSVARINMLDLKNVSEKTVLDIGCGYGWFVKYVLKKNVRKIYAIEISDEDLVTARKNIKDPRVSFKIGSAIDIPLKDESVNTVVCWEVLEHIPKNSEKRMFEEISRVLKPGGIFYMSTPCDSLLSKLFDPAWWLAGHRHYTERQLRHYGSLNKLELSDILVKGRFWSIVYNLNMYFSKWVLRRQPLFKRSLQKKSTQEYKDATGYLTIFAKFVKSEKRKKIK